MSLRDLIIETQGQLVPINDWLESSSPAAFGNVLEITHVQIEVASEVIEEIRKMLVDLLQEAYEIVSALDLGQESVAEAVNKLLTLGKLINALVGVVQGVGEMSEGIGQQMGPSWDFTALRSATNGMSDFRNGFSTVMDQIPNADDWEALDVEMNRLKQSLSSWIENLSI